MHKVRYNSVDLELKITPRSPLLIKAGGLSPNPSLPDMQFVRTSMSGKGEVIYIPGSSFKGLLRDFCEKILKTAKNKDICQGSCNLFQKGQSCSDLLENVEKKEKRELTSYEIYKNSCRACKVFGNTKLKGRISVLDAYPSDAKEIKTETRHGVAISRLSHAVATGPFGMEVVIEGEFSTKIRLENFEVWQMGLLALALKGFNEGTIRIGFGKNRGFGEISALVSKIEFVVVTNSPKNEIWGIGKFLSDSDRGDYGINANDFCSVEILGKETKDVFYTRRSYPPESWSTLSQVFIDHLKGVLQ